MFVLCVDVLFIIPVMNYCMRGAMVVYIKSKSYNIQLWSTFAKILVESKSRGWSFSCFAGVLLEPVL